MRHIDRTVRRPVEAEHCSWDKLSCGEDGEEAAPARVPGPNQCLSFRLRSSQEVRRCRRRRVDCSRLRPRSRRDAGNRHGFLVGVFTKRRIGGVGPKLSRSPTSMREAFR